MTHRERECSRRFPTNNPTACPWTWAGRRTAPSCGKDTTDSNTTSICTPPTNTATVSCAWYGLGTHPSIARHQHAGRILRRASQKPRPRLGTRIYRDMWASSAVNPKGVTTTIKSSIRSRATRTSRTSALPFAGPDDSGFTQGLRERLEWIRAHTDCAAVLTLPPSSTLRNTFAVSRTGTAISRPTRLSWRRSLTRCWKSTCALPRMNSEQSVRR